MNYKTTYRIIFILAVLLFAGCGKKQDESNLKAPPNEPIVQTTPKDSVSPKENAAQNIEKTENKVLKYSSKDAGGHIGENAIVTGFVADVSVREKVAYLNFDAKYPNNTFTGVVFSSKFELFGDLNRFKNKTVELKGVISTYNNKAQIILNSPMQLKIAGK